MALPHLICHAAALLGKDYSSVFFVYDELFFSELVEHSCDCGWCDVEVFCNVDWFRVSFFADEFADDFDVVFFPRCLGSWCGFVGVCQFGELAFAGRGFCHSSVTLFVPLPCYSVYGCFRGGWGPRASLGVFCALVLGVLLLALW